MKAWTIGVGAGFILLGVYTIFSYQQEILISVIGIILIALGLGIIASDRK